MIQRIIMAGRPAYSDEALALFARMVTPPNVARKRLIDATIRTLKAYDIWDTLDALYLTAAADSQAAALNWVSTSFTISPVSSPTFTADRGWQGNGSSSYLNTTYQGSGSSINDVSAGVWINAGADSATALSGGSSGNFKIEMDAATVLTRLGAGTDTNTAATAPSYGAISRSAAPSYRINVDGSLTTAAVASGSFTTGLDCYLLAAHGGGGATEFSAGRVAAAHFGSALTDQQMTILYAALNTYLTSVGGA